MLAGGLVVSVRLCHLNCTFLLILDYWNVLLLDASLLLDLDVLFVSLKKGISEVFSVLKVPLLLELVKRFVFLYLFHDVLAGI